MNKHDVMRKAIEVRLRGEFERRLDATVEVQLAREYEACEGARWPAIADKMIAAFEEGCKTQSTRRWPGSPTKRRT
jgi:hypothetical protein